MANAMQCVGVFTGMRCPSHAGVFLGWVSLPFPVFTRCVNCEFPLHTTGLKTRGYSPSASRLSDAIYLMRLFFHGFKNPRLFALEGFPSSRRLIIHRSTFIIHHSPLIAHCSPLIAYRSSYARKTRNGPSASMVHCGSRVRFSVPCHSWSKS